MSNHYDVIVLGAGPGGYVAAIRAAQFGISGTASFDYGVAVDRSRKVADGHAKGVHYLMR